MPISDTIVKSNNATPGTSSTSKAANDKSIMHVSGDFKGTVSLQVAPNGTDNWVSIIDVEAPAALPVSTPDPTLDYRFSCNLSKGSVNLYFGA